MIADDPGDDLDASRAAARTIAARDELEAARQEATCIRELLAQALFDEAEVFVVDSARLAMTIGTA